MLPHPFMRHGLHQNPSNSSRAANLATVAVIAGAHIVILLWINRQELLASAQTVANVLSVSLIRDEPIKPPEAPPPPPPPKPQLKPVEPPPLLATQPVPNTPAAFEVPPPKAEPVIAPPPAPVQAADPAPAPVMPPDFTASYLDNPAPAYPAMSRKLQEQGRVLLRVFVSPAGKADRIELQRSSGYSRLDDAAQHAVKSWRFVPATQGGQPIAAWVVVPLSFSLS